MIYTEQITISCNHFVISYSITKEITFLKNSIYFNSKWRSGDKILKPRKAKEIRRKKKIHNQGNI